MRKRQKGFTLVEIMLTVSLLSIGAVMVYQSNLITLDVYGRYTHRLSIQNWVEEKMWKAKEGIFSGEEPELGRTSGEFIREGKLYEWRLNLEDTDIKDLYLIQLNVSWKEGRSEARLSRAGFAQKIKIE